MSRRVKSGRGCRRFGGAALAGALSLVRMRVRWYLLILAAAICLAQQAKAPDESGYTFGITAVGSSGLKGDIYLLKPDTDFLPNFKKMKPVGSIYTPALFVQTRNFREGFPGVTDRFEWFAIDYNGRFWVSIPGTYSFALTSDDGSKLYIDGKTIIDNDGIHPTTRLTGKAKLKEGIHRIRVSYYQGPADQVALILAVSRPGRDGFYIFNTNNFRPPPEKFRDGSLEPAVDSKPGGKSGQDPRR